MPLEPESIFFTNAVIKKIHSYLKIRLDDNFIHKRSSRKDRQNLENLIKN